jgi:hypothetical protein
MDSSGEENPGASADETGEGPTVPPEQPAAINDLPRAASSLTPEFVQCLAELRQLVHAAKGRTLTVGEQQAVTSLVHLLRSILGAGNQS